MGQVVGAFWKVKMKYSIWHSRLYESWNCFGMISKEVALQYMPANVFFFFYHRNFEGRKVDNTFVNNFQNLQGGNVTKNSRLSYKEVPTVLVEGNNNREFENNEMKTEKCI